MTLSFFQYPYGSDNYGVLVRDEAAGITAAVDAGDIKAAKTALRETGWTLDQIWITHHHGDHTAGLTALKAATGATVYGPGSKIAGIDHVLKDGDHFDFGPHRVEILETPGHTLDMLNFHVPGEKVVFTGDTLFVLGCGRVFEGTSPQMWESLQKLAALPPETVVYCAHEYTLANGKFALSVDPRNGELIDRMEHFEALRSDGAPTVPTTIAEELKTNPFLRAHDPAIRKELGMEDASEAEVFTEIRARKDRF